MSTYLDPFLYAAVPNNPNVMGMAATLTEPVDADVLGEAIEELRERFPYFYVRPQVKDADLVLMPNKLPVVVRKTWEPTLLMSSETNYHICAWKCEGKRVCLEILHVVTDGSGLMPYFKSVLFLYLSKKLGIEFDREGFRLPGTEIPESEVGDPFDSEMLEAIEEPFYKKPEINDFVQLERRGGRWRAFSVRLPEDEVMRYCGELDASPNALVCTLLARAVHRLWPEDRRTILGGVAVNQKAALGNRDNYRCFSDLAYVDFSPDKLDMDLGRLCTIVRGQILLQTQPENVAFALKQMRQGLGMLAMIPSISLKRLAVEPMATRKRTTFSVSYAASRSFGPLDPYIEEFFVLAEPVASSVVCEIACINHAFFLHLEQEFGSEALLLAFLDELREVGIEAEVLRKEDWRPSSVRYDDLELPPFDSFVSSLRDMLG